MTATNKDKLVKRFFSWLKSKNCNIDIERHSVLVSVDIVQQKDGKPWTTICYETFPEKTSIAECRRKLVDRIVTNKLQLGFFERIGLCDISSYEELDIKLSILGG